MRDELRAGVVLSMKNTMSMTHPYSFKISHEVRSMHNEQGECIIGCWALDHYGLPGDRWMWDAYLTFYFKHEEDYTWFILRWS